MIERCPFSLFDPGAGARHPPHGLASENVRLESL
jgi:hypothetical protein